ncbi:Y-family DNA polymerase [Spiroplasma sp. ChiS]|uniref:Y-family DNA polymerase n=1 Tax=Spiroplasma sp. ChiS TaxID=2099885 RepID=UPI00210193AE|nr:hypothetical protein [Spiroplasma sp. ChiS]
MILIDKCYIDVTDIYLKYGSAMRLALDMQQNVFQQIGLPNSIGISYNKSLAKIASDMKKPLEEIKYLLHSQTKYIQSDQRILDETKLKEKEK